MRAIPQLPHVIVREKEKDRKENWEMEEEASQAGKEEIIIMSNTGRRHRPHSWKQKIRSVFHFYYISKPKNNESKNCKMKFDYKSPW